MQPALLPRVGASALSVALAWVLVACGGGGGGSPPAAPAPSSAAGLRFDNPQSQLALLAPAQAEGDPSAVLMRDTATGEIAEQVYVLADGSRLTVRTDAAGRLTYLAAGGYTFEMTDYTAESVTMTTRDPQGAPTVEAVSLVDGSVRALAQEPPAPPPDDPLDAAVDRALEWTSDVSNIHLIANIYRKVGETVADMIERGRQFGRDVADGAAELLHVDNEVRCAGADTAECGGTLAEKAPTFAREVVAMNPSTATTAGFDVNASGIQPRREEWKKVATPKQIEQGFTMTEVPCDESVFADMNPACPQYVPPTTDGGTTGGGTGTGGGTNGGGSGATGGDSAGGGTSTPAAGTSGLPGTWEVRSGGVVVATVPGSEVPTSLAAVTGAVYGPWLRKAIEDLWLEGAGIQSAATSGGPDSFTSQITYKPGWESPNVKSSVTSQVQSVTKYYDCGDCAVNSAVVYEVEVLVEDIYKGQPPNTITFIVHYQRKS